MKVQTKKTVLDKVDRQIIAELARDGRRSYREIARSLEISEGTVRTRMARLQDDGLIRVTLVGNPLAMGVGVGAMILLRVKPGYVRQTANALVAFPNVRFVSLSFGKGDVILQTLHKDVSDLHHFVSETIPEAAPEVVSTETLQLAEVLKSSWTWGDWFEYLRGDEQDDDQPSPETTS
ncbi:MAG: Lrp/AsnC family transcriptional regulator [Rhizobiaceae bacterium]|nr:Lrp/AsnC family transcriptional regulator [Rhizobiaceae bacterium]